MGTGINAAALEASKQLTWGEVVVLLLSYLVTLVTLPDEEDGETLWLVASNSFNSNLSDEVE